MSNRRDGLASGRTIPHTRIEDERQIEDKYEFGEVLGKGSFGVVKEARNKETGCVWAIKAVNKEKVWSASVVRCKSKFRVKLYLSALTTLVKLSFAIGRTYFRCKNQLCKRGKGEEY